MIEIPGRIPIKIHPTFWLIACLIAYLQSPEMIFFPIWILIVLIAILGHEFGHALTATFFGQRSQIDLVGFGGLSSYQGRKLSPWKSLLVTLNGPLAGLALVLIFYTLSMGMSLEEPATPYQVFIQGSLMINLIWTIFNLFPILPLDGGHLIRNLFEGLFGVMGLRVAGIITTFFCFACAGAFLVSGIWVVGILFFLFLPENIRFVQYTFKMAGKDRDPRFLKHFEEGEKEFELGRWEEALMRFQMVRGGEKRGALYQRASEYVAEILSNQGEFKEAFKVLDGVKKGLDPSLYPMYQKLAFAAQEWKGALEYGEKFFSVHNNPEVALTNALCCAKLEDSQRAVAWLKAAHHSGLDDIATILKRKEFEGIRQDPTFKAYANEFCKPEG